MNVSEVNKRAKALGLQPGKLEKIDVIHAIQNKEGNSPCFQTGLESCDQFNCCWRNDCLSVSNTEHKKRSSREAFQNTIKAELRDFNHKIEDLKMKASTMVGKRKTEALDDIKQLEQKCEKEIKQKIHKLTETSDDIWQSTKRSIENSWKDIKKSSKETFSKFGGSKPKDPKTTF